MTLRGESPRLTRGELAVVAALNIASGTGIRVVCIECGRRSPTSPDLRWTATVRKGVTVWLCEPCAIEAGLMAERGAR